MPNTEQTNIVGNVYDKYASKNPLARYLMDNFLSAVSLLVKKVNPSSILEVGCGEGHLINHIATICPHVKRLEACDLSLSALSSDLDKRILFKEASIYSLPWRDNEFDLVICCEVLEHLKDHLAALDEVRRVTSNAMIISVPREPLWRILNLCRGKYIKDLGNTPGHIQHFSRQAIFDSVSNVARVETVHTPIPWTVLLGTKAKKV